MCQALERARTAASSGEGLVSEMVTALDEATSAAGALRAALPVPQAGLAR